MKKIILTGAIALLTGFASAQVEEAKSEETTENTTKTLHKIGLHAGTTSGLGLSYKIQFADKYQVQLTTLPIASESYKWINTGLQLRYKFKDAGNWDFFTYAAASHLYTSSSNYYYYDYTDPDYSETTTNESYNASAGVAFEFGRSESFKLNLQTGYGVYDITDDWTTMLTIGVGIDFTLTKTK